LENKEVLEDFCNLFFLAGDYLPSLLHLITQLLGVLGKNQVLKRGNEEGKEPKTTTENEKSLV
jgi:hypothetical protein